MERTVIVTAQGDSGKALSYTLHAADLRAKINDKPMQILAATKPSNQSRVVLVLDASGSIAGKWLRLVEFGAEIVHESPSSTEFALVMFADKELRKVEFGRTGPEMITEIMSFKNVNPYGKTPLRDAIWEAVSLFQPNREGDTIVVVSDGGDNQSKVSPRRLREAMWSRGIRVMFAQVVDHFATQPEDIDNRDAAWLSQSSGGFLFPIEDPQVLPNTAHEIASRVENYLALRVALPTVLEKEASIHLEAVDSSGRKRKNVELAFPEKLLPCASLTSRQ
jgi:hypothetical protein